MGMTCICDEDNCMGDGRTHDKGWLAGYCTRCWFLKALRLSLQQNIPLVEIAKRYDKKYDSEGFTNVVVNGYDSHNAEIEFILPLLVVIKSDIIILFKGSYFENGFNEGCRLAKAVRGGFYDDEL